MRQRLLLVAGWIVAAVGAGVVASGAVAAAGGQVLDRPLRPLTAAEVAALPVDETMAHFDLSGPHASGGTESTVESTIVGSGSETTGPTGDDEPAGPGGASADQPATPVDDTLEPSETAGIDRDALPVSQTISDVAVTHVTGGSASLAAVGDELRVLWATPKPGYVVGLRFESPTQLFITFTSTSNQSTLAAVLDESGILIDTSESRR
ncbi:MAG: hypothetical protein ABFR89_00375 [Actinomycetota bacterium]